MKSITLQSSDSVISSSDVLGRLGFAASSESDGSDSILVSAMVKAVAEGDFTQTSNATSLVFSTALSSTASDKLKITSEGHFVPFASGQYDLGSPNYHFRNIYADNIIGDYSGQLDGNLDLNGYDIVGTGNITIDGNVTAEYFYGDLDGVVVTECRNDTGSTIAEGTPVYVAGYYSSNGKPLVAPADCANATKMPAIGLLASELTTGSEGHVHVFGLAQNLPSGVTNDFSVGNTVYVDNGGGLTNVRPTGVSELVQNIGRVLKTGTNGRILVLGPGRSNDVPNSGHFEQLTVDGYTALAVDNGNVGIGTASPSYKLDVAGSGHFDDNISVGLDPLSDHFGLEIYKDKPHIIQRLSDPSGAIIHGNWYGNDEVRFASIAHYGPEYSEATAFNIGPSGSVFVSYEADIGIGTLSNDSLIFGTSNTERARINPAGNFGIGTDNPSAKLNVENGNVVFNDLGGNYDFRVEGDSDPNVLVIDASSDKVGIGGYPDDGKLTIDFTNTNDNSKDAIYIENICNSTSNGTYQNAGIDLLARKIVNNGVTDTGQIIGLDAVATLDGDGHLNSSYGARTWGGIYTNQSGTLTNAWGIQPRVINAGYEGSLISDARGIDISIDGDLYNRISSDGITNAKALYIRPIKDAANKYGIYQEGSSDDNYFAGDVGLGVTSPSARLDINSNKLRLRTAKTPSSSSDTGNTGDICWDGNYIYVCVSTNTWKRSSLSTW